MDRKNVLDEEFMENYPPVLVFFPQELYKDNSRLVRFKRDRNYEGNFDANAGKVYIKNQGLWVSTRYLKFIDFSYNEKCLVLESITSTPIQKMDIVESLTGLKYDREYGGFYSKVRRWVGDEEYIVSADIYLRPIKSLNLKEISL